MGYSFSSRGRQCLMASIIGLALNSALLGPSFAVELVDYVDPERYAGEYYELALIPYRFEKNCAKNAKVRYTLLEKEDVSDPTVFEDYFECEKENGKLKTFLGRAKVVDTESNAKLSATFFKLFGWRYWFGENYWIIGRGEDYEYTVVGNPNLKYGWVMARTPELSSEQWKTISETLESNGYDLCEFQTVIQDNSSMKSVLPLCEFLDPSPTDQVELSEGEES